MDYKYKEKYESKTVRYNTVVQIILLCGSKNTWDDKYIQRLKRNNKKTAVVIEDCEEKNNWNCENNNSRLNWKKTAYMHMINEYTKAHSHTKY